MDERDTVKKAYDEINKIADTLDDLLESLAEDIRKGKSEFKIIPREQLGGIFDSRIKDRKFGIQPNEEEIKRELLYVQLKDQLRDANDLESYQELGFEQ